MAQPEVRPEVVEALARLDTRLDPAKLEVAYNATHEELRAAVRQSAERAVALLREAGVAVVVDALELTFGQWEAIAACWEVVRRWDVSLDRDRRARDGVDMLVDSGVFDDAAWVYTLLRLRGLLEPEDAE